MYFWLSYILFGMQLLNLADCTIYIQSTDTTLTSVSDHGYTLINNNIIFEVKGCSSAVLELSSGNAHQTPYFGISLGDNQDTAQRIYKVSQTGSEETRYFLSVLDCNKFIPFWIQLDTYYIRVGHGNIIGNGIFMSWTEDCPIIIRSVWVRSELGVQVNWAFPTQQVQSSHLRSKKGNYILGKRNNCQQLKIAKSLVARSLLECSVLCDQRTDCFLYAYGLNKCDVYRKEVKDVINPVNDYTLYYQRITEQN